MMVLQTPQVGFRGQVVAVVVAESAEAAREGALLVTVTYDEQEHRAALTADDPDLYKPEKVNPEFDTDSSDGDVEQARREATHVVDATYTTPYEHNSPLEPHALTARWRADGEDGPLLTLHASTQQVHGVVDTVGGLFGLEPEQLRVLSPYVGGGFGSKGLPKVHDVVASLAAKAHPGRRADWPSRGSRCSPSRATGRRRSSTSCWPPTTPVVSWESSTRSSSDLRHQGVRRADRRRDAAHVRRPAPGDQPPAGRARRRRPVVDARAR